MNEMNMNTEEQVISEQPNQFETAQSEPIKRKSDVGAIIGSIIIIIVLVLGGYYFYTRLQEEVSVSPQPEINNEENVSEENDVLLDRNPFDEIEMDLDQIDQELQ